MESSWALALVVMTAGFLFVLDTSISARLSVSSIGMLMALLGYVVFAAGALDLMIQSRRRRFVRDAQAVDADVEALVFSEGRRDRPDAPATTEATASA